MRNAQTQGFSPEKEKGIGRLAKSGIRDLAKKKNWVPANLGFVLKLRVLHFFKT